MLLKNGKLDVKDSFHVLTIVLFCSNVEGFGLEAEARMTTWHVMMASENETDTQQSQDVSEGTTCCHVSQQAFRPVPVTATEMLPRFHRHRKLFIYHHHAVMVSRGNGSKSVKS